MPFYLCHMSEESKYLQRGVSARKEDVHAAIRSLDKGLYPNAFCKIFPDYLGHEEAWCNLSHGDGTGTKSALAYIYWKETGDISVWRNLVVDNIVMNLDDLLCAGATNDFLYTSLINRNKQLIPGEVIRALIEGASAFFEEMKKWDLRIHYMGGETADLGDSVRTLTVDAGMTCRMKRSEVLEEKIQPGDLVLGLSSFGQTTYEQDYNSGIGSNGLTAARHDVLHHDYAAKYPESYNPLIEDSLVYAGHKKLEDPLIGTPLNTGQALLSPTRTYAPILLEALQLYRPKIHGLIHCTGGGQGKVLHFIEDLQVIKNNLFPVPPLFRMIQEESGTPASEMYRVFNMGHRMEIYTDEKTAAGITGIAARFGCEARIVGEVRAHQGKEVVLHTESGEIRYAQ